MSEWIYGWEDNYDAELFENFEGLSQTFANYAESEHLANINVPVWIHYESEEDVEDARERRVEVGIMGTRKGRTWIWISPATPEQVRELQVRMMRVWAGRADSMFARYKPYYSEVAR